MGNKNIPLTIRIDYYKKIFKNQPKFTNKNKIVYKNPNVNQIIDRNAIFRNILNKFDQNMIEKILFYKLCNCIKDSSCPLEEVQ